MCIFVNNTYFPAINYSQPDVSNSSNKKRCFINTIIIYINVICILIENKY